MTLAEILFPACPACGVASGAECVSDAATCEERLEAARAHRVSVACPDCGAAVGECCRSKYHFACNARFIAAQPGNVPAPSVPTQLDLFGGAVWVDSEREAAAYEERI